MAEFNKDNFDKRNLNVYEDILEKEYNTIKTKNENFNKTPASNKKISELTDDELEAACESWSRFVSRTARLGDKFKFELGKLDKEAMSRKSA